MWRCISDSVKTGSENRSQVLVMTRQQHSAILASQRYCLSVGGYASQGDTGRATLQFKKNIFFLPPSVSIWDSFSRISSYLGVKIPSDRVFILYLLQANPLYYSVELYIFFNFGNGSQLYEAPVEPNNF